MDLELIKQLIQILIVFSLILTASLACALIIHKLVEVVKD